MTEFARVLHRATGVNVDTGILRDIMIFCGAGLLLSLLMARTYGLDLSPGFF